MLNSVSLKQIRLIASWASLVRVKPARLGKRPPHRRGIWSAMSNFRLPGTGGLLIYWSESGGGH